MARAYTVPDHERHVRIVASPAARPEEQDALATLLAEGERVSVWLAECCQLLAFGKRKVWRIRWVIASEGTGFGRPIFQWMRAIDASRDVPRGSEVAKTFTVATGLRPPAHLARMKPVEWLAECEFEAVTTQVRKDSSGVERPEAASYSRVKHLVRRTAGAPPALRSRTR